uniref:Uncharacterized protein n=1 Tax=Anguilla anguilla TaxID=7936 RepID=A0A0E9V0R2_ANGAN
MFTMTTVRLQQQLCIDTYHKSSTVIMGCHRCHNHLRYFRFWSTTVRVRRNAYWLFSTVT